MKKRTMSKANFTETSSLQGAQETFNTSRDTLHSEKKQAQHRSFMRKILFQIPFLIILCLPALAQSVPGQVKYPSGLDDVTTLLEARNLVTSRLTVAITSNATTLTVADASGFPATGGAVSIENEVIYYTGKSGNQLTGLLRAKEGTVAASHAANFNVRMTVSQGYHNSLRDAIIAVETKLGTGSSGQVPGANKVLTTDGSSHSQWVDISSIVSQIGNSGSTSNNDDTIIRADANNDGTGAIFLNVKNGVTGLKVNNDGTVEIPIGLSAKAIDKGGTVFHIDAFGGKGDGKWSRASTTAGNAAIVTYADAFTSTAVDGGKTIILYAAGANGDNLETTISSVTDSTHATLAVAPSISIGNTHAWFGSNNDSAFAGAKAAALALGGPQINAAHLQPFYTDYGVGTGTIQLGFGNYIITKFKLPALTSLNGQGMPVFYESGTNPEVSGGSSIWSSIGNSNPDDPMDGIISTAGKLNSSFSSMQKLSNFGIWSLNPKKFQACFADIGSTYLRIDTVRFNWCHYGAMLMQTELSSVANSIFETYDGGYTGGWAPGQLQGGILPTDQGWVKVGAGVTGFEPMVAKDDCYQCGRLLINSMTTDSAVYYKHGLGARAFEKGFYFETEVPEVVNFEGTTASTQALDDGTHRYEIRWSGYSNGQMSFKLNNESTVYLAGLSDKIALIVAPGGATAKLVGSSSRGQDTVLKSGLTAMTSVEQGMFFGDLTTTNDANTYWRPFSWDYSFPRAAGLYLPAGDDGWASRWTVTGTGAWGVSGDNQIACFGCTMGTVDIGKTIVIPGAGPAGADLTVTVSNYYGDGYSFQAADITDTDTEIPVDRAPNVTGNGVWLYGGADGTHGSERVYCTGSQNTAPFKLTGCQRGKAGTAAEAHNYLGARRVSWNVFRTWVFTGGTLATAVNNGTVTYKPSGGPEFVNVIQVFNNQFNGGATQIADEGGYVHDYWGNNHNGGGHAFRIAGSHEITIRSQDFEGQQAIPILITDHSINRITASGSPMNITIENNLLGPAGNPASVKLEAGDNFTFRGNLFPQGFGIAIANASGGGVYRVNAWNNRTQGARLFQANASNIEGNQIHVGQPIRGNGGMFYDSDLTKFRHLSTGPIEMRYLGEGWKEEVRGALATGAAGQNHLTITDTPGNGQWEFTPDDVEKIILVEYADTPNNQNSYVLTTTIASYISPTEVTLATNIVSAVGRVNALWYRNGPKTPAITFYDAYNAFADNGINSGWKFDCSDAAHTDPTAPCSSLTPKNYYARLQGLTAYTMNRHIFMPDMSGYMAVTPSALAAGKPLYIDSEGRIASASAGSMASDGKFSTDLITLRKSVNDSTNQDLIRFTKSSGTSEWAMALKATTHDLTFRDDVSDIDVLRLIRGTTYTGAMLEALGGLVWSSSDSPANLTAGLFLDPDTGDAVEVTNGKSRSNGGTIGAFHVGELRTEKWKPTVYTPAQWTTGQPAFDPGNYSLVFATANQDIGFYGMLGGSDGRIVFVVNTSAYNINLGHQDAGASAPNRFIITTGSNATLSTGKMAMFVYDGTASRWRVAVW